MNQSKIQIIGGSKEQPKWLDKHQSLGVQEDNVAAEYCFSPCTNEEQFVQAIEAGKSAIQSLLKCANLKIHIAPSGIFPDEELEHPMAKELVNLAKRGESVAIEISPLYFSTWDDSKIKFNKVF